MAATTNSTPSDSWTKIYSASEKTIVSCSSKYGTTEVIAHTSGTSSPADGLEGYRVDEGKIVPVTLPANEHLWERLYRDGERGSPEDGKGETTGVHTAQPA